MSHCERLKSKRHLIDKDLVEASPDDFTNAMRMGVVCALNADPRKTYWGKCCEQEWSNKKRRIYGCVVPGELNDTLRELAADIDATEGAEIFAAREIMIALTKKKEDEEEVVPNIAEQVEGEAPEKPNAFSDRSLKNTKGPFLAPRRGWSLVAGTKSRKRDGPGKADSRAQGNGLRDHVMVLLQLVA